MKNLKKVLAFALVVCMMLSTIVSATAISATDYTDYSTIKNADQVAVLTELGVINGYPDESFKPEKTVSRAEMAKMITVILNKGTEAAGNYDGAQVFSDVYADMWCKGYINYCNTLGIVVGMGDGTYKPNQGVTVVQTAKMLLVAMGYDPVVEGFEGANWEVNVSAIAAQAGLYNGVTANAAAECSRDTAALIIYNALVANTVDGYTNGKAVVGDKTMLGKYFNAVVVTGVVVANDYANLFGSSALYNAKHASTELALIGTQYVDDDDAIDPGVSFLSNAITADASYPFSFTKSFYDSYGNNDNYASQIFEIATTLEQVGQTVKVIAQLKDNYDLYYKNVASYPDFTFSGKVIGVAMDVDCVVKEIDGTYNLFDTKELKKEGITFDSTTRYFMNYAVAWSQFGVPSRYGELEGLYTNYTSVGFYNPSLVSKLTTDYTNFLYTANIDGVFYNADGVYTKMVDVDGDGVVEMVLQWRPTFAVAEYDTYYKTYSFDYEVETAEYLEAYKIARVTSYDSLISDFFPDYSSVDPDDVICEDDIDDGDKVLVVYVDGKYYVEVCESKTVTVDTVSVDADKKDYVKADGTTYYESGIYWSYQTWYESDAERNYPEPDDRNGLYWNLSDCATEKDYILYFDSYGNVVAYEEAKGGPPSDIYAMVTASYVRDNVATDNNYYLYLTKGGKSTSSYVEVQYHGTRAATVCENAEPFFYSSDVNRYVYLNSDTSEEFYGTGYLTFGRPHLYYNTYLGTYGYNLLDPTIDTIYGKYSLGYFTALIKADYNDDDEVCVDTPGGLIDFTHYANGDVNTNNLSINNDRYSFTGSSRGSNTIYYSTSDTVYFIFQYAVSDTGEVTVEDRFSVIGDSNLPTIGMSVYCPCDYEDGDDSCTCGELSYVDFDDECDACTEGDCYCGDNHYVKGITAMYGVANKDDELQAVVIETNASIRKTISDYVFIYRYSEVSGSAKNHTKTYLAYAFDQNGDQIDPFYVDVYHSDDMLDANNNPIRGIYAREFCEEVSGKDYYDISYADNYDFKNFATVDSISDPEFFGSTKEYVSINGTRYYTSNDTEYFFRCAVRNNSTSVTNYQLASTTLKNIKKYTTSVAVIWKNSSLGKEIVAMIGGYNNPMVYNNDTGLYAEMYTAASGFVYTYDYNTKYDSVHFDSTVLATGHSVGDSCYDAYDSTNNSTHFESDGTTITSTHSVGDGCYTAYNSAYDSIHFASGVLATGHTVGDDCYDVYRVVNYGHQWMSGSTGQGSFEYFASRVAPVDNSAGMAPPDEAPAT